ncbi:hypothetical protein [Flavihumibacter solisilvae]|nr:hypothetical protein [Flavihumibacter solisilvae]
MAANKLNETPGGARLRIPLSPQIKLNIQVAEQAIPVTNPAKIKKV